MFERVLVPLDGSALAESILPAVRALGPCGAKDVILLRIAEHDITPFIVDRPEVVQALIDLDRAACRKYLESIAHDFHAIGFGASAIVSEGSPAERIVELANERIDLIAMSTHGRTGVTRWLMGSVADRVLHTARTPVLLARAAPDRKRIAAFTRVLVPLDGSGLAETALPYAEQLARCTGAKLELLRVAHLSLAPPYSGNEGIPLDNSAMEAHARRLCEDYLIGLAVPLRVRGLDVSTTVTDGPDAEEILAVADASGADLIVMSTHGRSGVRRWLLGSVADRVLAAARVPILLVRSGLGAPAGV